MFTLSFKSSPVKEGVIMSAVYQNTLAHSGPVRLSIAVYFAALLISTVYILSTGTYNGDFHGVRVTLPTWEILVYVVVSALPYIVGYLFYRRFSKLKRNVGYESSPRILSVLFFGLVIWFILLAVFYNVGVLGRGLYAAPEWLTPIIQITNRLSPYYLGVFFISTYKGDFRIVCLAIFLLVVLGVVRASLGVFIYIGLALVIRNHIALGTLLTKHFGKILTFLIILPLASPQLYSLRSQFRGQEDIYKALSVGEVVSAQLAGRLSSISNTAFVMQEEQRFSSEAMLLDPFYFQKQALGSLLGVGVMPEQFPEKILINSFGGDYSDVSYMAGVGGNLAFGWFISPIIFAINIVTMLVLMWICFLLANRLPLRYANEVCVVLMLYPLTSGVANEFSYLAVFFGLMSVIFWIKGSTKLSGH